MMQHVKVRAFTVSELLWENQQGAWGRGEQEAVVVRVKLPSDPHIKTCLPLKRKTILKIPQ